MDVVRNALVPHPAETRIEIDVRRDGDLVELAVVDDGPGLPVEDGAGLFERFWRADPGRGRGAAGAGSAWRSSRASWTPTVGRSARTPPAAGRRSWSSCCVAT